MQNKKDKEIPIKTIEREIIDRVIKDIGNYINPECRAFIKKKMKDPGFRLSYKRKIAKEIRSWSDEKKKKFYSNMRIVKASQCGNTTRRKQK